MSTLRIRQQPTTRAAADYGWSDAVSHGPKAEMVVLLTVWHDSAVAESTFERMSGLAHRFATRLVATGVGSILEVSEADCESFMWAPTRRNVSPSVHTVHLRRTALRGVFRVLHQLDPAFTDPTATVDLPGRHGRCTRPLSNGEIVLLRTAALGRNRQPLRGASVIALAEATDSVLYTSDIKLSKGHRARVVLFTR